MTDVTRTTLEEDMQRALDEIDEIRARYGTDESTYPSGQKTRYDNLARRASKLLADIEEQAERAEKYDAIRAAALDPANRESGFGGPSADPLVRRRSDPWRDLGDVITRSDSSTGLRTRALDAIEVVPDVPTQGRAFMTKVVETCKDDSAAEFVLATANPAYRTAFEKIIKNPTHGHLMWDRDELLAYQRTDSVRAALSLTNANGGYMVPFVLDPSIVLTDSGALNPWRELASIKTTTSNAWQGVTSAGVTAEWTAEGVEAADATPTVGQIQIYAEKADAYVFGSYEVLGDTDFGSQLPMLLADAKNRLEEAAFATGAGHGSNVPQGVITAAIAGSKFTTGSTVATLSSADIFSILQNLPDRWKANASFVMNLTTGLAVRQLGTSLGAAFWANLGEAQPEQLLGKRYRESTTMNSTVATGNYIALVGDLSQYYVVDRLGVQLVYVPAVIGTNKRPTGQAGWYAYWRVGGGVATVNAFNLLKVK